MLYLFIITFGSVLCYILYVTIWRWKELKHLNRSNMTSSGAESARKALEIRTKSKLLGLELKEFWLISINIILALVAVASYRESVNQNEKVYRPYIEIQSLVFKFYDGEKEISMPAIINNIKEIGAITKINNHGEIPAEIISHTINSTEFNWDYKFDNRVTVYDQGISPTINIAAEKFNKIIQNNSKGQFSVKEIIKYRIPGGNRIYEAHNKSDCFTEVFNDRIGVVCIQEDAGTN